MSTRIPASIHFARTTFCRLPPDWLAQLVSTRGVRMVGRRTQSAATCRSLTPRSTPPDAKRGSFFLARRFARHLLATEPSSGAHRSIVFVTSGHAGAASLDRSEYCVSKAAAAMAARLFALRLAGAGIGVHFFRPGIIRTEMTLRSKDRYDAMIADGGRVMPRY